MFNKIIDQLTISLKLNGFFMVTLLIIYLIDLIINIS